MKVLKNLRRFSALQAQIVKPQPVIKSKENHGTYLISEHGDLLNLKSYARARTHKTNRVDLREVKYITDNTDAKFLLKQLNQNPTAFFLFHPDKTHYLNSRTIYNALKKLLNQKHYGHLDRK